MTTDPLAANVQARHEARALVERAGFLENVYKLDSIDVQEAVDVLVDRLDDLQNLGDFDEVEATLFMADPSRLTAPSIVSVLGITLAAKGVLIGRRAFYRRALKAIADQRGSKEAAEKLLIKYR